jgi:hypothetical protein
LGGRDGDVGLYRRAGTLGVVGGRRDRGVAGFIGLFLGVVGDIDGEGDSFGATDGDGGGGDLFDRTGVSLASARFLTGGEADGDVDITGVANGDRVLCRLTGSSFFRR